MVFWRKNKRCNYSAESENPLGTRKTGIFRTSLQRDRKTKIRTVMQNCCVANCVSVEHFKC